jgi:hypothetical protein
MQKRIQAETCDGSTVLMISEVAGWGEGVGETLETLLFIQVVQR